MSRFTRHIIGLMVGVAMLLPEANAQKKRAELDSLLNLFEQQAPDTSQAKSYLRAVQLTANFKKQKQMHSLAETAVQLAKKQNNQLVEGKVYGHMANYYSNVGNTDSAAMYFGQSIAILELGDHYKALGMQYSNYGTHLQRLSEYSEAGVLFEKGRDLAVAHQDSSDELWALSKLALLQYYNADYDASASYYLEAIDLAEILDDRGMLLNMKGNYAMVKAELGQDEEALNIFLEVLDLRKDETRSNAKAILLNNIGEICLKLGRVSEARTYFEGAVEMFEAAGNERYVGYPISNLGDLERGEGNYEAALAYFERALEIKEKYTDKIGMIDIWRYIGEIELAQDNTSAAIKWLNKAMRLSEDIGSLKRKSQVLKSLSDAWDQAGNDRKAYQYYSEFQQLNDSLLSQEKIKTINELETRYDAEKKARKIEELKHEQEITEAAAREQLALVRKGQAEATKEGNTARIMGWIAGGVVLLMIVLIFGVRSKNKDNKALTEQQEKIVEQNRVLGETNAAISSQKSALQEQNNSLAELNEELDLQQHELKSRNKEITDSIMYARRLQEGVLPSDHSIQATLPESFVYYLPKDIVSGDFYWMEESGDDVLFSVVDCTGHGVPGAFMSMVGHNSLHRALVEYKQTDPGALVTKLEQLVQDALYQHDDFDINDGMDLALGRLNLKERTFSWAGAHNPVWLVRNTSEAPAIEENEHIRLRLEAEGKALYELKGTKRSVGGHGISIPFATHSLQLYAGDMLYLSSDGYVDQFGGEKGKKFKSTNLRQLLLNISQESADQQKEKLASSYVNWKGELEQVDDICVMGVRIT